MAAASPVRDTHVSEMSTPPKMSSELALSDFKVRCARGELEI